MVGATSSEGFLVLCYTTGL